MPVKRSKRYQAAAKLVDKKRQYTLPDAIALLKQIPPTKADQTLDLAFHLGVDPRQSDQMVRGTVALPHGSGNQVRVLVFAKGAAAEAAKSAGAEYVGFEDLIKQV
ncbi:MAG: 50S ribosomal protein L1, partial [Candidatus Methylacidiphilales bacterium]|nr:50S ribosomal protein L1 [Candidatus Methylacidiphilales bacterium]